MKLSGKWIATVLSAAIATTFVAVPAQAAPNVDQQIVAALTQAYEDPQQSANVTQFALDILAEEKPEAYAAAIAAVDPYTVDDAPLSTVPQDVVATIDTEIWSALLAHETAINFAAERGTVLTDAEQAEEEQKPSAPISSVR